VHLLIFVPSNYPFFSCDNVHFCTFSLLVGDGLGVGVHFHKVEEMHAEIKAIALAAVEKAKNAPLRQLWVE
jgi:hypothetical protein